MSNGPPERFAVSIPPTEQDLDLDRLDDAVERSEYASRSAFVRAAIRGEVSLADVLDAEDTS